MGCIGMSVSWMRWEGHDGGLACGKVLNVQDLVERLLSDSFPRHSKSILVLFTG